MLPGDKVFIWDPRSDLFIFKAEVLEVKSGKALVMVKDGNCIIADSFDIGKLYKLRSKKRGCA
jgi:hypothetical protein